MKDVRAPKRNGTDRGWLDDEGRLSARRLRERGWRVVMARGGPTRADIEKLTTSARAWWPADIVVRSFDFTEDNRFTVVSGDPARALDAVEDFYFNHVLVTNETGDFVLFKGDDNEYFAIAAAPAFLERHYLGELSRMHHEFGVEPAAPTGGGASGRPMLDWLRELFESYRPFFPPTGGASP